MVDTSQEGLRTVDRMVTVSIVLIRRPALARAA